MAERRSQSQVSEAPDGQQEPAAAPPSAGQPSVGTRVLYQAIYGGWLVALLNHGQVAAERGNEERD